MNEKLERELASEESQAVEVLEAEKGRRLRELKDRHAAEMAARSKDMSPEEVQQVRVLDILIILKFIYQARGRLFQQDFRTPRSRLKKTRRNRVFNRLRGV